MSPLLKHKRLILGTLSILVSGGLLANLLRKMDWAHTAELFRNANHAWMLLAVGLSLMLPLCAVVRWTGVLKAQPLTRIPFSVALRAVLMANVLNSLLPSKAGDLAKAFYLRRHASMSVGLGTVILERMIDFLMLGSLGIAGALFGGPEAKWGLIAGLILVGHVIVGFAFILLVPLERMPLPARLKVKIGDARTVFHHWIRHPAAVLQTLAGSLLNWSFGALSVCAMSTAFGTGLGWDTVYSIFPLAILAGLVPLTMSGVGTRDQAFVALLMAASVSREKATLIGIGYTVFSYWLLSLISLPVVFWEVREFLSRRNEN